VLTECAWGATRRKDGFLKRKYYSIKARRGGKKAAFAVGHKILIAAYFVLKNKEPYKPPALINLPKQQKKLIDSYRQKIKALEEEINARA
jgi:hypothetical protein